MAKRRCPPISCGVTCGPAHLTVCSTCVFRRLAAALLAENLSAKHKDMLPLLASMPPAPLTSITREISLKTNASEPTARRFLHKLRRLGLATGGSKGRKFKLTSLGKEMTNQAEVTK